MNVNSGTEKIIFFDGVCNLCNASVDFIIRRDRHGVFRFASLQSDAARERLPASYVDSGTFETIVLYENGQIYDRSTAALRISRHLSDAWPLFSVFLVLPRFLRDPVYRFISRNRYKWFGKSDTCRIPTPEERALFLDA